MADVCACCVGGRTGKTLMLALGEDCYNSQSAFPKGSDDMTDPSPIPPSAQEAANVFDLHLERVAVHMHDGVIHIRFSQGKADGQAVRELFEASARITDRYSVRVIMDMAGVTYVPSGMMGMLVTVRKKISSVGGQFHIVVSDPLVRGSFEAMRLERMLSLFDSTQAALNAFKR